jgi:hypothetical protein
MLEYNLVPNGRHLEFQSRVSTVGSALAPMFPELDGVSLQVRTKRLRGTIAQYDSRSNRIDIDPTSFEPDSNNLLPSVLARETMHALQNFDRSIPYGERSCDIYTLARLPDGMFPRTRDFYVKVPQKILSANPAIIRTTAVQALERRSNGVRNYIIWFEDELRRVSRQMGSP